MRMIEQLLTYRKGSVMKHSLKFYSWLVCIVLVCGPVMAVPWTMEYQGKINVNGQPFSGNGLFRFALMDESGTIAFWTNDGSFPPIYDKAIWVEDGQFNVTLGDTMAPIFPDVFSNDNLYLRIWFDDGVNLSQMLSPDKSLSSIAHSIEVENAILLDGHGYNTNRTSDEGKFQMVYFKDDYNSDGVLHDPRNIDSDISAYIAMGNIGPPVW